MNNRRLLGIIVMCLAFSMQSISQEQIKILDDSGNLLGRFKTQLYQLKSGESKKLRGDIPSVRATGEEVLLYLRIEDLRWNEDSYEGKTLQIGRANIRLSDKKGVILSSNTSSFILKPGKDNHIDIEFKAVANGNFSLSIPFNAWKTDSKFMQAFKVEDIEPSQAVGKPIGAIADIRKEWKETDRRDEASIQAFIDKYKDNSIAQDEGILALADRTLRRVKNGNTNSEDQEENVGLVETKFEVRAVQDLLVKRDMNIFSFDLSSLEGDLDVKLSHPDDIEVYNNGGNQYELKVKGSQNYTIYVTETLTNLTHEVYLNNEFRAKLNESTGDYIFSIAGGVSPFTAEFYKEGELEAMLEGRFNDLIPESSDQIIITRDMLNSSGMDGRYGKVIIRDYTTESLASFPINLEVSPSKTGLKVFLGILIGVILIGSVVMVVLNGKKKKKREEYLAKAKALQREQQMEAREASRIAQSIPNQNPPPVQPRTTIPKAPNKITISKNVKRRFGPYEGSTYVSSGKMKIVRREAIGGLKTAEEFKEVLKGDRYAHMDLNDLWPDTAVEELFVSKECIKALGKFLKEENLDKAVTEMDGAIPEVGGFLMGYHSVDEKSGRLRVTMDEFVPFVPEYHDVFKIEIGTATLVQELGDAQDTHPDKDVIGWFHTHPGHGLFLSNSDLSVQRHFPQKYQIAMEIDSLTKALDTAFFTRKNDGTINNVEHRHRGAKWFSWKKIENV